MVKRQRGVMAYSDACWPSMWPSRMGDWPTAAPRERWAPSHDAAAVCCLRLDTPVEVIEYASYAEAAEAIELLYSDGLCGPLCQSHHVVVWCVAGEASHVATLRSNPPRDLGHELARAGYRRLPHDTLATTPAMWPRPSILNRPQRPPAKGPVPMTQRRQDEAIANAANADRVLTPHPRGLGGRISDEIAAASAAFDAGDVDAEAGHSATADALTAAAVAEIEAASGTGRTHRDLIARQRPAQAAGTRSWR